MTACVLMYVLSGLKETFKDSSDQRAFILWIICLSVCPPGYKRHRNLNFSVNIYNRGLIIFHEDLPDQWASILQIFCPSVSQLGYKRHRYVFINFMIFIFFLLLLFLNFQFSKYISYNFKELRCFRMLSSLFIL